MTVALEYLRSADETPELTLFLCEPVGRFEEIGQVFLHVASIESNWYSDGAVLSLRGESGIGASSFLARVQSACNERGNPSVWISGKPFGENDIHTTFALRDEL